MKHLHIVCQIYLIVLLVSEELVDVVDDIRKLIADIADIANALALPHHRLQRLRRGSPQSRQGCVCEP
jgi:hypothetical protein